MDSVELALAPNSARTLGCMVILVLLHVTLSLSPMITYQIPT